MRRESWAGAYFGVERSYEIHICLLMRTGLFAQRKFGVWGKVRTRRDIGAARSELGNLPGLTGERTGDTRTCERRNVVSLLRPTATGAANARKASLAELDPRLRPGCPEPRRFSEFASLSGST